MIHYASTSLLNVAYQQEGASNAQTVILLHGWPDDPTTWDGDIPYLVDAGYRVIAPWLRGFGTTTFLHPNTARTGNSGIIALDILELMDALELQTVNLIGHDWGANIAEALAVGWPDRIDRMALLSTPPRLGGMPTPPFAHAQLEWYRWFQATKRGAVAVRADPMGFAHIMWKNCRAAGAVTRGVVYRGNISAGGA